jgi:hypothetical protein
MKPIILKSDESTYETSQKDFRCFIRSINYWMDFFGIAHHWRIAFSYENLDEPDYYAAVQAEEKDRACVFLFPSMWDEPVSRPKIDVSAFHEVLHLVLATLDSGMEKVGNQHAIIRMFEQKIYPKLPKRKEIKT